MTAKAARRSGRAIRGGERRKSNRIRSENRAPGRNESSGRAAWREIIETTPAMAVQNSQLFYTIEVLDAAIGAGRTGSGSIWQGI